MNTIFAFQEAVKISPVAGQFWLERLGKINAVDFEFIFNEIPDSEISETARNFALKMLSVNQNRLLNL